ncbi:MAG: hypothetical protein AAFR04_09885 [Pseudomonadota bacterium]
MQPRTIFALMGMFFMAALVAGCLPGASRPALDAGAAKALTAFPRQSICRVTSLVTTQDGKPTKPDAFYRRVNLGNPWRLSITGGRVRVARQTAQPWVIADLPPVRATQRSLVAEGPIKATVGRKSGHITVSRRSATSSDLAVAQVITWIMSDGPPSILNRKKVRFVDTWTYACRPESV